MTWLIQTEFRLVKTCRRKHSDRTCYHTCFIRQNITEHILCQDNIKLCRIMHQLHCTVINQHMLQCDFRIVLCNFFYNFSPESGRIQNVCFVYTCDFFSSLHCNVKSFDCNTANFIFIIGKCIDCFLYSVFFDCFSFSKVKTTSQFTNNDHVKSVLSDHFFLDRACFFQFLIKICRTKVCKEI